MANIYKPPCDEAVILTGPLSRTPPVRNVGTWVLVATILGSSMAFIDGSVVNVALPVLQRAFNATVGEVQWVMEAYSLFLAALILVGGSLGDIFGRRRIFSLGVMLFALSSIWCGLSPSILQLIIARSLQGIGGALLVPGSLAIISASFSPDKRGRAIGTWSGFTSITSAIGPVLGGWLVEHASWHWVFFINVPLAIIVLAVLFWHVPESRDEESDRHVDWVGSLLVTIGLGALVYGLIQAGSSGFNSPVVLVPLLLGVIALIGFVLYEARSAHPMLPLNLFRSRTFSGANLLTLFLYSALSGALFFFPFNLIQVQGYSATEAGSALLPFVILMFSLSRWSGGLVKRYGAKLPLVVGPTIAAIGYLLFARPDLGGSYWTTFFPAAIFLGLGMTISVAPLTTTVMGSVSQSHAGVASGVNNAVSRAAGLLSIAVMGILLSSAFNSSLDSRLASLHLSPALLDTINAQRVKLAGITLPGGISEQVRTTLTQAIKLSFVDGFRVVMFTSLCLALLSALVAGLMIEGKRAAVDQVAELKESASL
ncbi:MAG: MFS transporter [Ktedonobacteraceae bacterium]|nr:MFS transporter [Ktedonobacteraceae bacterium]